MIDAYDRSLIFRALTIALAKLAERHAAPAREARAALTRAIVEAARYGMRDHEALADYALLHYDQLSRSA